MFSKIASFPALATAAAAVLLIWWPRLILAMDSTVDPELVAKLKAAATSYDRGEYLSDDSDWLFDFPTKPKYTFEPGGVINANIATFPAIIGTGMTMAMLNLGPCSMLPPHLHPRASNLVVAVHGETATYMLAENGARVVKQVLTPGKMTVFPRGSLHTMMNLGCTNAQLVSALDDEDTGTLNVGYGMQNLPSDLWNAAFGYQNMSNNDSRDAVPDVGTGSVYGPKECLAHCAQLDVTPTCGPEAPRPTQSGEHGTEAEDEPLYESKYSYMPEF